MSTTPTPKPPPLPPPPSPSKICFNSVCKEPRPENPRRKGWRLRSGDHAELCDRCCLAYEQGTFCETFHGDVTGWRKCETCGKKIHCGCIVSVPTYVLLDVGGVECIVCARKALSSMAPNHMWSHLHMSSQVSERPKEHPVRTWTQMSSSFPGQWRQGTHLWNNGVQSDLQQRLSFEFDRPNAEKLIQLRSSIVAQEKKVVESSSLNHVVRNGTAGMDSTLVFNKYHRDHKNPDSLQDSGRRLGDNDTMSARKGVIPDPGSAGSSGVNFETHPNCAKPLPSSIVKGDSPSLFGLSASFSSPNGSIDPDRLTVNNSLRPMAPPLPKQLPPNPHNMNESAADTHNGRSRMDARARAQLLPRYWPRITDQELQQISGDSNSVITPLFEKMLSASDAGRIGRLVLPKKCAEAYFPPISLPEGLPLKVQDVLGNEWAFQFRFWPNNNSRMYVLEGVTPCIQAMKLQAGDIVTFSRIDPEGKLVMGYRKPANVSSEQDTPTDNNINSCDSNVNGPLQPQKGNMESRNPANVAEHAASSKLDKTEFIQKDEPAAKSSQGLSKRKNSILGLKSKRLRIENEDSVELNFTWEESQGLLRPNPNNNPSIVVIEGQEFEEYEEAPVLGKPTIFTTNQAGDSCQWVQCEDCSKWRKIPADALLPSRWSCSENRWDSERSLCSSAQETSKELTDILSTKTGSRRTRVNSETIDIVELSNSLDTLANLAILGEGESLPSSSQPTTRHPRHRPGCTCIVCIQPPSGKGPKHKQTCTCNVCLTVKRRFRTLMMRREKKQSEKEAETATARNKESLDKSPETPSPCSGSSPQSPVVYVDGAEDGSEKRVTFPSPLKAQIDLNIQPEREEEQPSSVAETAEYV